jgi:hypothetical protein
MKWFGKETERIFARERIENTLWIYYADRKECGMQPTSHFISIHFWTLWARPGLLSTYVSPVLVLLVPLLRWALEMPFLFLVNCKLPLCCVNWLLHVNSYQPVEGQPIWLSEFLSSKLCGKSIQVDDTEVINFLLSTEIIPLCLRTMEMGSELSKTVS